MNKDHHDLNDVHRVLVDIRDRLDTISRQTGRLQDLSGKQLAEQVGQTAILKSIDSKLPPPRDIGTDGGDVKLTEGKTL